MSTILGIAGSLRAGSFNHMLLRAFVEAAPAGTRVEIATIADVPLYNYDVEAERGIPPPVARLKDLLAAADGLLLVTPEYNNSIPGVLKNVIDWMSRPPADVARVFRGKPVAIAGASAGAGGTGLSQVAWLPVIRTLGMQPWFGGRLQVGPARNVFDASGTIIDEQVRERVARFIDGFGAFVAASR